MADLQARIEELWEMRGEVSSADADAVDTVHEAISLLDTGMARVAEVNPRGKVVVHEWLKQAILLLFRLSDMETMVSTSLAFMSDEIHREPYSAVDVASLLISQCDTFCDSGRTVTYKGPDHAQLTCRPVALRRAFSNLIDNGCKYGGEVCVSLTDKGSSLVIEIRDNGPGIPADQMERAFAPFQRLEASRNRETGGTGLGLTIARDVILGHGGDIQLINDAKSFLVRVELPRPHN